MLIQLEALIRERKANPQPGSYTNKLFDAGIERIAQKVGEEATEVVIAALRQPRETQINEVADLFYHTLVLMTELGLTLDDVMNELARRHQGFMRVEK
jgi:phosphoribosyl-ATP pyrophosphohydrolase/phosphoribosyl-AMP cyclohydrolase